IVVSALLLSGNPVVSIRAVGSFRVNVEDCVVVFIILIQVTYFVSVKQSIVAIVTVTVLYDLVQLCFQGVSGTGGRIIISVWDLRCCEARNEERNLKI